MAYVTIPASSGGGSSSNFVTYGTAWHSARITEMLAVVPQLTQFNPLWIGSNGGALTIAAKNTIGEGGSTAYTAATVNQITQALFMTPKTGKWAVAFRCVYAVPVAARYGRIGIINTANSHLVSLSGLQSSDATHFTLEIIGAATTSVIASGTGSVISGGTAINMLLAGDGTTITAQVNAVTVASTTTLTNLSDEPMGLFSQGAQTQDAYVIDNAIYGYVAP